MNDLWVYSLNPHQLHHPAQFTCGAAISPNLACLNRIRQRTFVRAFSIDVAQLGLKIVFALVQRYPNGADNGLTRVDT